MVWRQDLDPVVVRVGDEVDAHCRIFEDDAAEGFVQRVGHGKIVGFQREMELVFAEVVRLWMVAQPGQLKLVLTFAVAEIDDDEAAVFRFHAAHFLEAERLIVESETVFKIGDIEIIVQERKLHVDRFLLIEDQKSTIWSIFLVGVKPILS